MPEKLSGGGTGRIEQTHSPSFSFSDRGNLECPLNSSGSSAFDGFDAFWCPPCPGSPFAAAGPLRDDRVEDMESRKSWMSPLGLAGALQQREQVDGVDQGEHPGMGHTESQGHGYWLPSRLGQFGKSVSVQTALADWHAVPRV